MQPNLPAVLQSKVKGNSISMERALKQVLYFLNLVDTKTEEEEQALMNSIEDVEFMISKILK